MLYKNPDELNDSLIRFIQNDFAISLVKLQEIPERNLFLTSLSILEILLGIKHSGTMDLSYLLFVLYGQIVMRKFNNYFTKWNQFQEKLKSAVGQGPTAPDPSKAIYTYAALPNSEIALLKQMTDDVQITVNFISKLFTKPERIEFFYVTSDLFSVKRQVIEETFRAMIQVLPRLNTFLNSASSLAFWLEFVSSI
jgi:hypothetical protein